MTEPSPSSATALTPKVRLGQSKGFEYRGKRREGFNFLSGQKERKEPSQAV